MSLGSVVVEEVSSEEMEEVSYFLLRSRIDSHPCITSGTNPGKGGTQSAGGVKGNAWAVDGSRYQGGNHVTSGNNGGSGGGGGGMTDIRNFSTVFCFYSFNPNTIGGGYYGGGGGGDQVRTIAICLIYSI